MLSNRCSRTLSLDKQDKNTVYKPESLSSVSPLHLLQLHCILNWLSSILVPLNCTTRSNLLQNKTYQSAKCLKPSIAIFGAKCTSDTPVIEAFESALFKDKVQRLVTVITRDTTSKKDTETIKYQVGDIVADPEGVTATLRDSQGCGRRHLCVAGKPPNI